MDFSLTDEQEMLRATARTLLHDKCPASLVRAHMDDPSVADDLWKSQLSDWVSVAEGDLVDVCLFLEELGAAVAPGVWFPTTALFLPLLRAIDHPYVPSVLAGEVTGTVALAGADGLWVPTADPTRTFVLEADRVDHLAIVTSADGGGATVAVVDRSQLPNTPTFVATMDTTRRAFTIDVADLGTGGAAADSIAIDAEPLADVLERMTVALAAEMIGVTRWMLDTSIAYAKERVQFDRPIGSFQGVQYKLVDMALDYERANAAVYYAAMTIDADDADRHRAVHVAKAAAGAAAKHVARDSVQVLGGIGYTWEHDLHLYLRRAYASDYLLGPGSWHEDQLANLLFA